MPNSNAEACFFAMVFKQIQRAEIGMRIYHCHGHVVCVHDPFNCEKRFDSKFFKHCLNMYLLPGKNLVADNGYSHENCITPNKVSDY